VLLLQAGGWGAPASEDIPGNVERLAAWTDAELARQPSDLAVLPELSTTPYFCCRRDDRYFEWAEPVPGPATDRFAEIAHRHGTTIVLPLFERVDDGRFHNTAAVIGPDGDTGTYRKCHLPAIDNPPDTEAHEDYFFDGGDGLPVFEVNGTRLGVLICYDRFFPEAWRSLALAGAELVVVPMVAWGFVEAPHVFLLQARALENGVFVACCNRSEREELDGVAMDHFGRSVIVAPDGAIVALAETNSGETTIGATLDLADLDRQRDILPLLRHRRADLYGGVNAWT
jgi:predicted amidohydrolase